MPHIRDPLFLPALVLGLALAACGDGRYAADEAGTARVERLALTRVASERPASRLASAFHVQVGDEIPDSWRFRGGKAKLHCETAAARGGPWTGIEVGTGRNEVGQVAIPGTFDPADFNRAVVSIAVKQKVDVALKLMRDGKPVAGTEFVRVSGDGAPTQVVLDLPKTLRMDKPCDEVVFLYSHVLYPPRFLGLELLWVPLRDWLPDVDDGPSPVPIGDEVRTAVGLAVGDPLAAEVDVPPLAALRFGYGRPAGVRRPGDHLRVTVEVVAESGARLSHAFHLPGGDAAGEWSDGELRLADLAGERAKITFALQGSEDEVACAIAAPRIERRAPGVKTIVLVTSDTHRADHLGARAAGVSVRTPFLDGLAERGVLYEDAFSSTNITNPSHAALLTAVSPRDLGLIDNITALADGAETLAERFRDAGYVTLGAVSAGHMRHEQSGLGQGFDRMYVPHGRSDVDSSITIERLDDWLSSADGLPLFVWLHVFDAHAPYTPPESHRWLYYEGDPYDESLPELPKHLQVKWDAAVRDLDYFVAQYKSEVTYLDDQLARCLSHPRFADAIVAVTGDHGESLGNHDLYFTHHGLYPDTLGVPLILAWPGAPGGQRVSTPVSHLDLGRTLLDLAGLVGTPFPGENLLRWTEAESPPPEPRYAISSHAHSASMELEGWFLVLNLVDHGQPRREKHQVELYDLRRDPACVDDLVDAEPERAKEMRAALIAWLRDASPERLARANASQSADMLDQLAALGYATEGAGEPLLREQWYEPDPADEWCRRFE